VKPTVYPPPPTITPLLTGLMHEAMALLRQEWALATHEVRAALFTIMRAVMSLGVGAGIAAVGGWLLLPMLVHLLHALTALPLWACYGIVGGVFAGVGVVLLVRGTQQLARIHLVPQNTAATIQENVPWLNAQVMANSRATRDRQR
jgi:putative superfamily III holin-X